MHRLAHFDVAKTFRRPRSKIAAQLVFGLTCALAMIGLRTLVDFIAPAAGPFALVYPTVLIATLFGHWRGGLVALLVSFGWAWYFVLEATSSFTFVKATDPARVAINFAACSILIVFAEAFRRAVRSNADRAELEIARRKLLMADLEHRTKNNFALVASLLAIQKRQDTTPGIEAALDLAINRIHTFKDAYSNLTLDPDDDSDIDMAEYLSRLTTRVAKASLHENVRIDTDIARMVLPREKAVAIGLFTNEALANCGKYAFADGRAGSVKLRFQQADDDGWTLEILDDGAGNAAKASSEKSGLGSNLFTAFAMQAGAEHEIEIGEGGARVALKSRPAEPSVH